MKPFPLRLRIALLSAAISGSVLLVFGGAAWYRIHRDRVAALDREIRALGYRHPGWMSGRASAERLASALEFVFGEDRPDQFLLLVTDTSGAERYRSPHWPPELEPRSFNLALADDPAPRDLPRGTGHGPPWASGASPGSGPGPGAGRGRALGAASALTGPAKIPSFVTRNVGSASWRLGVMGYGDDRLILGLNCAALHQELRRLRRTFLTTLPLALLAIGGSGWWVAGRAIRPLRSITHVVERVTARGLDQRIPLTHDDPEVSRLIQVLNGMMDRLEASFHQATRFSADASHELRTPLAIMQGELEAALQNAPPGSPAQRTFANLLEETQRLKTITQNLLLLARADAGQLVPARQTVDLRAALAELQEDVEALTEPSAVRLEVVVAEPAALEVFADWPLLRQALLNLLQNAIRYNEPRGWVRLELTRWADRIELLIANAGAGIPAADQPRLFDRFYRGDAARTRTTEGAGLGLSLAREIVRAHGGSLSLRESRPGYTAFLLSLPAPA